MADMARLGTTQTAWQPWALAGEGQGTLRNCLCLNCEVTLDRSGPQNPASPSDIHHLVSIYPLGRVWASTSSFFKGDFRVLGLRSPEKGRYHLHLGFEP